MKPEKRPQKRWGKPHEYNEIHKLVDTLKSHCRICGEHVKCCLDFHHIDPTKKVSDISSLISKALGDDILAELSKCVVVCSNCHRKIHAGLLVCPPAMTYSEDFANAVKQFSGTYTQEWAEYVETLAQYNIIAKWAPPATINKKENYMEQVLPDIIKQEQDRLYRIKFHKKNP